MSVTNLDGLRVIEAQSFKERIESKLSCADKHPQGHSNVEAVLTRPEGSYLLKEWIFGGNVVTTAGDTFYVKKIAGESVTGLANSRVELGTKTTPTPTKADTWGTFSTNGTTNIAASRAVWDTSPQYPLRNDTDTDNTGKGATVYTYRKSWTTTDFTGTGINNGAIHDLASPANADQVISHWFFSSAFAKTSSDTLKVYINHSFSGS